MRERIEIRICGLGGQGVVLAGQILGKAAVYDGKNVVQTQSYGAEARGSAAKSEVIISNSQIGFPMVRKCDILVAMSQTAVDKYIKDLKENGFLLIDESLVEKIPKITAKVFKVPSTKKAENIFKTKLYANIIMLGALTKITGIVSEKSLERAISESVPENAREQNLKAFKEGLREHYAH